MADIPKKMKDVVEAFGWNVNLMNGFWVDVGAIGDQGEIIDPLKHINKQKDVDF